MSSRRILYVGHNLALLAHLQRELTDCLIVRCPDGTQARAFIESINYSLLLFDEELPGTTGADLAEFSRSLSRTECTPFILVNKQANFELLLRAIRTSLPCNRSATQNPTQQPPIAQAGAPKV